VRLGRFLFRWRSLTPVPIVVLIASLAVWRFAHEPRPPTLLGGALALGLCITGQLLRSYVRGVAPPRTSSQRTTLDAGSLHTNGAYRFTRNPLYLGNLLICLGLFAAVGQPLPAAIGVSFFFFEYHFIIRAEEAFLRERFGESFEDYVRRVPRFWPSLTPAAGSATATFDWRAALRTEHNVAAAWLFGLWFTLGGRMLLAAPSPSRWLAFAVVGAFLAVIYLGVKGWKRRWWLSGARATAHEAPSFGNE
jgi:protein-S-isoprenylcysteine O-methyltransferase Ste14